MDIYISNLPDKPNIAANSLARAGEDAGVREKVSLPALPRGGISAPVEKLLCLLDRLIEVLLSAGVLRALRVIVSVACFFTIIGIAGGIERGLLDWRVGALATLAAAAIEALCIKKCK